MAQAMHLRRKRDRILFSLLIKSRSRYPDGVTGLHPSARLPSGLRGHQSRISHRHVAAAIGEFAKSRLRTFAQPKCRSRTGTNAPPSPARLAEPARPSSPEKPAPGPALLQVVCARVSQSERPGPQSVCVRVRDEVPKKSARSEVGSAIRVCPSPRRSAKKDVCPGPRRSGVACVIAHTGLRALVHEELGG